MNTLANVLPASQARSNFYTIINEVSDKLKSFTITLRGKAKAIVMPVEEVEAWKETMDILANKKLVKDIYQGMEDIKRGKVISEKNLLKELGINKTELKW